MDKVMLTGSAVSLCCLILMMFLTSPNVLGPLGIMLFFILIYVFFLGLAVLGCRLFFVLLGKVNKLRAGNVRTKSYRYGTVVALAPVILMLCASFGGLKISEIVAMLVFEFLMCFLVSRNVV